MSDKALTFAEQKLLWSAACVLERGSLVARLSELTGEPVTQILKRTPRMVSSRIHRIVQQALWQALRVALYSMDSGLPDPDPPDSS